MRLSSISGHNAYGQCGYETSDDIGDGSGEMGDDLDTVDLGTFTLNDIKLSNGFTCVSSSAGTLKCFGLNDEGQLGLGDTDNRGDDSDEMGDYLDTVDLGDDFIIDLTELPAGYGGSHSCLISDDLDVTAWGSNDYGQLGNGDETGEAIGDEANEMGGNLTYLDLSRFPTDMPTTDPTGDPTADPTSANPTTSPTTEPTISPSTDPTVSPSTDPTMSPTSDPTAGPTTDPTASPSTDPTVSPSSDPTASPTADPSSTPTDSPTTDPTTSPTTEPTSDPTGDPTESPTVDPTFAPTVINEPHMCVNERSTCSVWHQEVKCWGDRSVVDPTYTGGAVEYWYIPQIDELDIGDNFTAEAVGCGLEHQCALSWNGTVRCWGNNTFGQLGYGNTGYFNDSDNFGTDIDFGTDVLVDDMGAGTDFNCILSEDGDVKCFGRNEYGQLGYGDTDARGDDSSEMGDYLDAVDLGDTWSTSSIAVGGHHVCAVSDGGEVKCWGRNDYGQLGYENTDTIGDASSEMGDDLDVVDLGSTFVASQVVAGALHTCAVSTSMDLKCWGMSLLLILFIVHVRPHSIIFSGVNLCRIAK